jgi:uncharacterized protein YozE (UPF0346 family)
MKQFKRDISDFGNLARDMQEDNKFSKSRNHTIIIRHLKSIDSTTEKINTFEEAFIEYQRDMGIIKNITQEYNIT